MIKHKDTKRNKINFRQKLIERMSELENSGNDCSNCPGTCCTYVSNSMMCSPLEALELYRFLDENGRLTEPFLKDLKENQKKFRLQSKFFGDKSYLRKTYTCPLFSDSEKGCTVSRSAKPYGCLAFNNHDRNQKASNGCYSEKELMEKISHIEIDEYLRSKLKLDWVKAPITVAILDLYLRKDLISSLE